MPFNGTAQRAKNVGVTVMCLECERWRLFYSKQKLNEQEKKLLIAYLDTIDYSSTKSKNSKKRVSSEIELSNSEHSENNSEDLLNQNKTNDLQYSDSEVWENLFYRNADINNELTDNEESDDYDIEESANSEK
ncbi:3227_t:CDS:2, partial [Racocetra persica]